MKKATATPIQISLHTNVEANESQHETEIKQCKLLNAMWS